MTTNINLIRAAVILLFAITFMIVGTTAPILYATHAPADEIIDSHGFSAEDTTTGSDVHYVCFDRTVHQQTSGMVFTELYLVNGGDERVEVGSDAMNRYFQEGQSEIVTPMELPDEIEPGEYRYLLIIQADLANGQVERIFTFESERFTIEEGDALEPERPESC